MDENPALKEVLDALKMMVVSHPKCTKPIGAPGSQARDKQDDQECAIDNARAVLIKHGVR